MSTDDTDPPPMTDAELDLEFESALAGGKAAKGMTSDEGERRVRERIEHLQATLAELFESVEKNPTSNFLAQQLIRYKADLAEARTRLAEYEHQTKNRN